MPTISRVLLPTGFSDLSRKAAAYAEQMAQWSGAQVHAAHVIPDPQVFVDPTIPGAGIPIAAPLPAELRSAAAASLDAFVKEALPTIKDRVKQVLLFGNITEELARYAEAEKIDLIVMGTHADGVVKRIIWGSIGKSVLERAVAPVLLVPIRGAKRT
jgi:nucleotide-binding universal stress UspA family protein